MEPKTCKLNCFINKQLDESVLRLLNTLADYANNYILNNDTDMCITVLGGNSITVTTELTFTKTRNIAAFEMFIMPIITNEIADNIHDAWKTEVQALIDKEKELYD